MAGQPRSCGMVGVPNLSWNHLAMIGWNWKFSTLTQYTIPGKSRARPERPFCAIDTFGGVVIFSNSDLTETSFKDHHETPVSAIENPAQTAARLFKSQCQQERPRHFAQPPPGRTQTF